MNELFRVYYGDGSVFEGVRPEDAPTHDVQVIAYEDPERGVLEVGRVLLYNWDFYIYSDRVRGWHGTNKYSDLLEHLTLGCGPGGVRAVLTGRWIDREAFLQIMEKAKHDLGMRRMSGRRPEHDGEE